MTAIRFVSRPSFGDLARVSFAQAFRSMGAQALHGFGWGVAAFGVLVGIPADVWVPPAVLGVLWGTGLFGVFFQWWTFGRHPERLVETVTADESGIVIEARDSQVRQAWKVYREANETRDVFILSSLRTMGQVLAKRGVSEAALDEFRDLLRAAGLLRAPARAIRAVVGFVAGALTALSLPFVAGIASFG